MLFQLMFDPKISPKNSPVKGLIFFAVPCLFEFSIDKFRDTAPLMLTRYPGRGGGFTLGIFGWGCAAWTLEPLAYTRASSAEFFYPIIQE